MSVTRGQCDARPTVTFPAHWLVPNYTAWRQRHMCVNNLSMVAVDSGAAGIRTRDLGPTDRKSGTLPLRHRATLGHDSSINIVVVIIIIIIIKRRSN